MKHIPIIILVVILIIAIAFFIFRNRDRAITYDDPNLLFEDNFDGTSLDGRKWSHCPEWVRQNNGCVWDDELAFTDGNGNLILRAEWDDDERIIRTGAVRTFGKFHAGYGYYEASIKFPTTPGIWGAFWMMVGDVSNEDNARGEKGVEIDIVESIWADKGRCQHVLHWNGYGDKHRSLDKVNHMPEVYDGNFHKFALHRTEEAYVFYIDDIERARFGNNVIGICPEKGYMKLTVESADWAIESIEKTIAALPGEMVVDYVRVYKQKPEKAE